MDGAREGAPAGKRQKRSNNSDGPAFPRGTIRRVRVHNFMTYTGTVVIQPGPRLNLVLGPNGTGKSSLVCALCIGLGGSTKLLGRADNLKDFIQRGCDEAWTEITLSGGAAQPDWVVRRDIKHTRRDDGTSGYSSTWKLNGTNANHSDVQELVRELNIQFDNLCQFLPQDRVVEFARMNPLELLAATQKAIGDARLYDQHQRLVQLREDAMSQDTRLASLRRELSKMEAENQALERDAERFRRRQKVIQDLEDIRKKMVWSAVATKQGRVEKDEEALEVANTLLQRHKEKASDDTAPLKAARQRAKTLQQRLQQLAPPQSTRATVAARERLKSTIDNSLADMTAVQQRINGLQNKSNEWSNAIAQLERDCEDKQRALDALPPSVDHSAAIAAASKEGAEVNSKSNSIDNEVRGLEDRRMHLSNRLMAIKHRLTQMDSLRWRRLQAMDRSVPGVLELHKWLKERKKQGGFKGPVYGPLGLEIVVPNAPSHAQLVEMAVQNMMFDFAATCREDEKAIADQAKQLQMGVRVHTFEKPLDTPYIQISGPAANYRRFGIQATLVDLIQAPPLVMQVLTSGPAALAMSYLATDDSPLDAVFNETNIRVVYTSSHEHRLIKASYDTDNGRQSKGLRNLRFLGAATQGADEQDKKQALAEKQRLEGELLEVDSQLEQQRRELVAVRAQLEEAQQRLNALLKEQRDDTGRRQNLFNNLQVLKNQLKAKRNQPDPLSSKPQLEEQQGETATRLVDTISQLVELERGAWVGVRERAGLELGLREAEMQLRALESASQEYKEGEARYKEQVAKVQRMLTNSRQALQRARREAELEAPLTAQLKTRLDALPDDTDELRQRQSDLESEMAGIVCNNPRALEEFQERQARITDLSKQVAEEEQALVEANAEMDAVKSEWLPELERVVTKINTAFSASFNDIGCVGEVQLDRGNEAGDDYAKYSIQILVKFREGEDLQLLTGTRQSGGERSVSTIMYLIALQGVTVTPFRVVDEINQGMDPVNERKVFGQLVAASCKPGTPQCFLLTPKLLPDLEYSRDITVIQIMNGVMETAGGPLSWDINALLGARAGALVAARG